MGLKKGIVGRREERELLQKVLASQSPEFISVIGRRRVGKTYLIKQVCGPHFDFELTGLNEGKKAEQLHHFMFSFRNTFPDFEVDRKPTTWLDAFFLLTQALESLRKKEKMVVFLDELPWLATKKSGFMSGLDWFWNSWGNSKNLALIICGSAASWMIANVLNNKGGLYNRVTKRIFLAPLTLGETEAYLRSKRVKLNRYQIVQIYMSIGGIPMYLNQVQPGLTAVQNIQEICFQRNGYLRKEFERLYASLFDRPENQIEIIRALASKRMGMTRQEIIAKTSFKNGGMLTKIIRELRQSGFIEIYHGYGKKSRLSLYRLIDPYSLFFLTFIEPLGVNSQVDFTKMSDLPHYRAWSGYAFENVCLIHLEQIRNALGIFGMYTSVSSFYAKGSEGEKGTQIDLVIDRNDKAINICEIKFSEAEYVVSRKDVDSFTLKQNVFRQKTKTTKHLFNTLITAHGAVSNANLLNHVDQVLTMEDLFRN